MDLATVAVILANVIGGAMAVPQAARLIIHRRAEGVSPAWAGLGLTLNGWWLAYGLGAGGSSWAIVPISAISIVSYGIIVAMIVRHTTAGTSETVTGSLILSTAIAGLVPILAMLIGSWSAVGVTLGAIYGVQLTPAVIGIYRATDLSGVSIATWRLAWIEALLWGVYGFPPRDPGILTFSVTGLIMSTAVLIGMSIRRPVRFGVPPTPTSRSDPLDIEATTCRTESP